MTDKLDFIYDSEIFIDLYNVLDIDMEAKSNEIKNAYIHLVKIHHPDHGGNSEMYQQITKAYEILFNKESRKEYDLYYLKKSMDEFKGDDMIRLKSEYKNFVDANIKPVSKEKLDELYEDLFKDREKYREEKINENELNRRINDIDLERKNDEIECLDDRMLNMMKELNSNLEKPISISEFFEYFKHKNEHTESHISNELILNKLGTLDTLPGYGTNYSSFMSDSEYIGSNLYSDITSEGNFSPNVQEIDQNDFGTWRSGRKVDTKLSQIEIENSLERRRREEEEIFNEVESNLTTNTKKKEMQKFLKNKHISEDIDEYYNKQYESNLNSKELELEEKETEIIKTKTDLIKESNDDSLDFIERSKNKSSNVIKRELK